MKLTIEIELGNDAMKTYADIRKALDYARKTMTPDSPAMFATASKLPRVGEGTGILDLNGNTVGKWEVSETNDLIDHHENIAAISAEMHTSEKWYAFYKAHCHALNGFPGFWRYAIDAADAFTAAENALALTGETFEYIEAVMEFSASIMASTELPSDAELRKLADAAIAAAKN